MNNPNIEEIKPNFFIQGKGNKYIRIYPYWKDINRQWNLNPKTWSNVSKDNINWKNVFIGEGKLLFFTIVLMILAFAYQHDIKGYKDVYENPCNYCYEYQLLTNGRQIQCTQENEKLGLCSKTLTVNLSDIKIK